MTKSITISYNLVDENLLMAFFERLKIQVIDPTDGVPQRVVNEVVEGLKNVAKFEQDELSLENAYVFLNEIRQNSVTTKKTMA